MWLIEECVIISNQVRFSSCLNQVLGITFTKTTIMIYQSNSILRYSQNVWKFDAITNINNGSENRTFQCWKECYFRLIFIIIWMVDRTRVFLASARRINASSVRRSATTATHWAQAPNQKMPFTLHKSATPQSSWVFATAASKIPILLKDHLQQHKQPSNRKSKAASRKKARRTANPAPNWCSILTSEVNIIFITVLTFFYYTFLLFKVASRSWNFFKRKKK